MKSTLLIITVCFSSFAFTGACAFNDPSGEPGDGSVTALADKLWMTGSIVAGGEKWYSFTVVNAYDYEIKWDDCWSGSGAYSADVIVSVFHQNRVDYYFLNTDDGYSPGRVFIATAGETVYIRVKGFSAQDEGTYRLRYFLIQPPSSPVGIRLMDVKSDSVHLAWDAAFGADFYNVYRSTTESGTYDKIGTTSGLDFIDRGLVFHTDYFYTVSAINDYYESGYSIPLSVTTVDLVFNGSMVLNLTPPTGNLVHVFYSYSVPGALAMKVHFSQFNTEACCDHLYLHDKTDAIVQTISGSYSGDSAIVRGDKITIEYSTDASVQSVGWTVDVLSYAYLE